MKYLINDRIIQLIADEKKKGTVLRQVTYLYFDQGSSDKIYVVFSYEDRGKGRHTHGLYGRRSGPFTVVESDRTHDKLVQDKLKKGYQIDHQISNYIYTARDKSAMFADESLQLVESLL